MSAASTISVTTTSVTAVVVTQIEAACWEKTAAVQSWQGQTGQVAEAVAAIQPVLREASGSLPDK